VRDIQVPPIVFVGCIGPVFLCALTIGLIYVYLNLPLFWTHGPELRAALEHYERIRVDVFQGYESPSALENIAIDPLLGYLFDELNGERDLYYSEGTIPEPIKITYVREYTSDCSVVIVDKYHNSYDVAFILQNIDGGWKVQGIVSPYNAGIAGALPLRSC
jgi:hypothetical protein